MHGVGSLWTVYVADAKVPLIVPCSKMPNIFLSNLFIAVYERSKYDIGKSAVYTEVIPPSLNVHSLRK